MRLKAFFIDFDFFPLIRLIFYIIIETFPEINKSPGYFKKIFKSMNASEDLYFREKS